MPSPDQTTHADSAVQTKPRSAGTALPASVGQQLASERITRERGRAAAVQAVDARVESVLGDLARVRKRQSVARKPAQDAQALRIDTGFDELDGMQMLQDAGFDVGSSARGKPIDRIDTGFDDLEGMQQLAAAGFDVCQDAATGPTGGEQASEHGSHQSAPAQPAQPARRHLSDARVAKVLGELAAHPVQPRVAESSPDTAQSNLQSQASDGAPLRARVRVVREPVVASGEVAALLAEVDDAAPEPEPGSAEEAAANAVSDETRTRAWAALLVRRPEEMLSERQKQAARTRAIRRRGAVAAAVVSLFAGAGVLMIASAKRSVAPAPPSVAQATAQLQRAAALIDCRPSANQQCLSGEELSAALSQISVALSQQLPGASMYACSSRRTHPGCSPLDKTPRIEATWLDRGVARRAVVALGKPAG